MERIYTCDKKAYRNKVELIGYITLAIFLYGLLQLVLDYNSIVWALITIVSGYNVINTFLTQSNPREIIVTDETITFASYGKRTFEVDQLTHFRVKQVSYNYQLVVRATDAKGTKGRFWVTYAFFNDKLDLLEEFNYLERKAHPASLRMRSRDDMGVCRPHERIAEEAKDMPAEPLPGGAIDLPAGAERENESDQHEAG